MATSRGIPSLDGLRALSVFAVICSHYRFHNRRFLPNGIFDNGNLGVNVFFAISGFLITYLLLKELNKTGTLSLKHFYLRRAFRIFPAFYTYLAVIAVLSAIHFVTVDHKTLALAAAYLWNYTKHPDTWVLGHTWSLCVEEQFYLLWPLCLVLLSRRNAFRLCIGIIAASPFLRVATFALLPGWREYTGVMLHTRADALMVGCFLALALDLNRFARFIALIRTHTAFLGAILFLCILSPWLQMKFRGTYSLPVGMSLEAFCCLILIAYATSHAGNPVGRFLNLPILRHIGIISYGIYLWQQLFTGPYSRHFLMSLVAILACAEASFWLIEKPAFWIRDRTVQARKAPAPDCV